MVEEADKEVDAIRQVLAALLPLSDVARAAVVDYVTRRLGMKPAAILPQSSPSYADTLPPEVEAAASTSAVVHRPQEASERFDVFVKQKNPCTDSEMAATVAYWLRELAPPNSRCEHVTRKDIDQYFRIGDRPLPKRSEFTLPNAKNAGYFESAGAGRYRLNAVGHNLVAHILPRDADSKPTVRRQRKNKKGTRNGGKRKSR